MSGADERDAVVAELNRQLQENWKLYPRRTGRRPLPHIRCADGVMISAQAGETVACEPENDVGPWTHVEANGVDGKIPRLASFEEGGVYQYVPIEVIADIILRGTGVLDV